ncbi:MAG: glutathione peroxidase [Lysobacterales bacterium]|jgi:glutathione peroxidase|nr:MAG: glutathione peroxidase [Xanthomonadales bacterium]
MRSALLLLLASLIAMPVSATCPPLLDFELRRLAASERVRLCDAFAGKVLLVVNTASKCGFTPQYEGLEALHRRYADQGFAVLGFPSNDFMGQEPGSEEEIAAFCRTQYGVEFPMFEKIKVRGQEAHPFYKALTEAAGGKAPRWNFHKYLIGRDGRLIGQYSSDVRPDDPKLKEAIEAALALSPP